MDPPVRGHAVGVDQAKVAPVEGVAGMLLTGGASRRMGFNKATLSVEGRALAGRIADCLERVASPAIEVGPGRSGLAAVVEDPPGSGPLVALSTGAAALRRGGHLGSVLVVACDLPLLDEALLRLLAEWPGNHSVVPVVDGHPQPLCARWCGEDLLAAASFVDAGERSMRGLLTRPGLVRIEEKDWSAVVDPSAFSDVDTPADLDRLGLSWRPATDSSS